MRLISVELEGYRRFEQHTKIFCDGKLTALVGPNEAGKSTILDAIKRLDDDEPISLLERTRGTRPADDAVAVTALWMIEPDDLKAIEIPAGSPTPRWLIVEKAFGGPRELKLRPPLRRDRTPRRGLIRQIEQVKDRPWFVTLDEAEESVFERSALDELISGLPDERATIAPTTVQRLREVADQIEERAEGIPRYAAALSARLREVAEHEATDHPTDVAKRVLFGRTPDFLRFRPGERQLESFYDLNDVLANPRPALNNLARLAQLNLVELRDAIAADDRGYVADLRERANAELKRRIDDAWDQSTVEPSFDNDDYVLRILVRTGQGGLHDIAQRSDGLRAFIALVAFTTEQARDVPPILLVDEAEIHLHYDAQADLVQMLGHQQQAPQVIYTTHSAGCLPQDLGTGVRIVVADEEAGRSSVDNWPWEAEGGFGPLLLGMGASAMAFVPTRGAVICEGAVEVVLLPTLLREAIGEETLDYQVAPGASEASPQTAAHIDYQGHRVLWLVDGDEGGRKNRKHLQNSNIPPDRILTLGGEGSGLTTEDLLVPEVFLAGVNEELRRSGGDEAAMLALDDIPLRGRWSAIEAWCKRNHVKPPNKGAVAHRIADRRIEGPLLAKAQISLLRALHRQLDDVFAG